MLLNMLVLDPGGAQRGTAQIYLDWTKKRWYLEKESPPGLWARVGYDNAGPFEPRPPDIVWLWDAAKQHNSAIIWTAPQGEGQGPKSGEARLYDPRDASLKEGRIRWTVDFMREPSGPPIGSKLRAPNVDERVIIEGAEQRRRVVLRAAAPRAAQVIDAYRARDKLAVNSFRHALLKMNVFGDRLDPATQAGQDCVEFLEKASALIVANRDLRPAVCAVNREQYRRGLYAEAIDMESRDPRNPMIFSPVFFDARPECQAFVLMHEYFHLVGVIDHGHEGFGDTRPAWALGDPSRLVHYAWRLASGASPECDEGSPTLDPMPRVSGGVLA